jgi:hypothetical protein
LVSWANGLRWGYLFNSFDLQSTVAPRGRTNICQDRG